MAYNTDFKFNEMESQSRGVSDGDVRIVKLPVKVFFEWSDKIISDHDSETDTVLEYESGFVMRIIPDQAFIYNGQDSEFLYNSPFEKP